MPKPAVFVALFSLMVICQAAAEGLPVKEMAGRAQVVLRVKRLTPGEGSKYLWYQVQILKIFKNESRENLQEGQKLSIAAYSGKPGIPEGDCYVYLEPFDAHLWKLVGGEAKTGVSHAHSPAAPAN